MDIDIYDRVLKSLKTKIYGTTIYIGCTELETVFGDFTTFTFQDLIHKGYIIALCHGDFAQDVLYTRMHSSCVTSETMRSLDCDCVSQLYGALKEIGNNSGILFYLIQEGRGCGYVGKSRACMNVQYHEDTEREINTFQAYESLGMQHDYRQYTAVSDILRMMGLLDREYVLLTNNPDKIEKFKNLGLNLKNVQAIEIKPNPFNQQYLCSKEKYGHILYKAKEKVSRYELPHQKVEPFDPYPLTMAKRFVHVASYYLPIKPTWNQIVLTQNEYESLCADNPGIEFQVQVLSEDSLYVKIDDAILESNSELLCKPYWFKVNVFYDIVTHSDYLLLEYGINESNSNTTPVIRLHSESIFNRFPLTDRIYKNRYKRSLEYIVRNGCGAILILYHDGRGSGLGYYVLNSVNPDTVDTDSVHNSYYVHSSRADRLGVETDRRDYYGALTLLKCYTLKRIGIDTIDVIHGNTSFETLRLRMAEHSIRVRRWIDVDYQTDMFGYDSIYHRIKQTPDCIFESETAITDIFTVLKSYPDSRFITTGIGSSEAHARYLAHLSNRVEYVPSGCVTTDDRMLILFSQGLSPNSTKCLTKFGYRVILITTYTHGKAAKDDILNKVKKCGHVITYPKEIPDNTLVRITGPYVGYVLAQSIGDALNGVGFLDSCDLSSIVSKISGYVHVRNNARSVHGISYDVVRKFSSKTEVLLLLPSSMEQYSCDLANRFIEGCFVSARTCSDVEFAHGNYQYLEQNTADMIVLRVITPDSEEELITAIDKLLQRHTSHTIEIGDPDPLCQILTTMSILNDLMYQIIQDMSINQRSWPGKARQSILYDLDGNHDATDNIKDVIDDLAARYSDIC